MSIFAEISRSKVSGGTVSDWRLRNPDGRGPYTYVDDLIRWLNKTFLNRDWQWPTRKSEEDSSEEDSEVRAFDETKRTQLIENWWNRSDNFRKS